MENADNLKTTQQLRPNRLFFYITMIMRVHSSECLSNHWHIKLPSPPLFKPNQTFLTQYIEMSCGKVFNPRLETPKRVIVKQCSRRSDAAKCGV